MALASDLDDALALYALLAGTETDGTERLSFCVIPGVPVSKSRARFGRSHVYSRPEMVAAEQRTGWLIRQAMRGGEPYPGNVALGCIFYRPNFQRVDADNMLKHICDAANGIAWKDDCHVTAIFGRVELDKANPRTVVVIGPHRSTLLRGANDEIACETCGKPFARGTRMRSESLPAPKYCSRECTNVARTKLGEPVPCEHCGKPFRRESSYRRMCSPECRVDSLRNKRRAARTVRSCCADCGKELTHSRGGRCRPCWLKSTSGAKS